MESPAAGRGPLRCPRWAGGPASILLWMSRCTGAARPWAGQLRLAQALPKEGSQGGPASSIPAMQGNKASLRAHHCITTSSFPCLLLTSGVCLYPLLICTRSIFLLQERICRTLSPIGPCHSSIQSKCRITDSVCSEMSSSSRSRPSFHSHRADSPISVCTASLDAKLNARWFLPLWSFPQRAHVPLFPLPIPCARTPRAAAQPTGRWVGAWVSSAASLWG